MTTDLRWRILTLQIVLVIVLAFSAGFLYWAASFTHSSVHTELTAQKITFPKSNSPAITTLPKEDAEYMKKYAGQPLDNGYKAETYANHFIAVHLNRIGQGKTYSQVSAEALANPTDQRLAQTVQTLFRGETLRGLLLNSWGWWTVGTYTLWAAIGLTIATLVVLAALLFELSSSRKKL